MSDQKDELNPAPMRSLDDLLRRLPGQAPPADLALRICSTIRRRQQRWVYLRLVCSAGLALLGVMFLLPAPTAWLNALWLPGSAAATVLDWLQLGLSGAGDLLTGLWSGLVALQGSLSPAGNAGWPGLVALALSAALLIDFVLPREEL